MTGRRRPAPLFIGLTALAGALALSSLLVGQVDASPADVWDALGARLGGDDARYESLVWSLRIPRMLAGLIVGAGLGGAGAVLGRVHRNPLADPYLVGISAAAGLGSVVGLLVVSSSPVMAVLIGGTGGALFAAGTRRLAPQSPDPTRLILVGLTLGLALVAWTVIVVFVADTPRLPTFTYFIFGSLGTVTGNGVLASAFVVVPAIAASTLGWRELDLLALGEPEARQLGVDVGRRSILALGLAGAAAGATVGLAGVIGFVGLLGPWIVRDLAGPSARHFIPTAALAGACIVVAADTMARWLAGPVEVPIGIVTSAIGGPLLAWLILRRRR